MIHRPICSSSNAFQACRHLCVSAGANFSHTRFFVIIFIFFLSQQPSALRKSEKDLIFTPNIFTSDGGVHRHQAIDLFLLYDTEINHGCFDFTSLNDAILPLPRLSVHALCRGFAFTRVVVSPFSVLASFGRFN